MEQHVYGGDGPERRFEVLEKKQEELGVRQKVDHQHFTGLNEVIHQKLDHSYFQID